MSETRHKQYIRKRQIFKKNHYVYFGWWWYDDDDDELIMWDGWPSNDWKPYFQTEPFSERLNTVNSQYAEVRIESKSLKYEHSQVNGVALNIQIIDEVGFNSSIFVKNYMEPRNFH